MDAIDLREYLAPYQYAVYRKADESLYSRYTFQDSPNPLDNLYYGYLNLNKPGVNYMWRKEYWKASAWCTATYGGLFKGDDWSVTEWGDWTGSSPTSSCAPNTMLGYKTFDGLPSGLMWSGPGGLSDAPVTIELDVWRQNTPGAAYTNSGSDAYSRTGIAKHLETFTPEYGRCADGTWGKGCGQTYYDVVMVVMYHGTKNGNEAPVRCENLPVSADGDYYQSFKTYNSYSMIIWLAKGIGMVQEKTGFIEKGAYWGASNCIGQVFQPTVMWTSFIDINGPE